MSGMFGGSNLGWDVNKQSEDKSTDLKILPAALKSKFFNLTAQRKL